MKKITKGTYTTLATVALLGSITTATIFTLNTNQSVADTATTSNGGPVGGTEGYVTMDAVIPAIKDGKTTMITIKNVSALPGGPGIFVDTPYFSGYNAGTATIILRLRADKSGFDLESPLVYTKANGNTVILMDAILPIKKDGQFATIVIKNVAAIPGGSTIWIPTPHLDGYVSNVDGIEIALRADKSGFDMLTGLEYTKTGADAGSDNGNSNSGSSSNSGDNSSNSSSETPGQGSSSQSSSQSSSSNSHSGSTTGTSQSSQGTTTTNSTSKLTDTNTNGDQQTGKTGNSASNSTSAKAQADQPTKLLQTGQDHPAMTVATVFSAVVAGLSGTLMFFKRF